MLLRWSDTLITSERLVLAPPAKSDFEDWARVRTDSREHLVPWEPVWPQDAHSKADWNRRMRAWRRGWKDGHARIFLIRRIEDNTLVGGVSMTNIRRWPALSANLGYWLAADLQGQGYMGEGVQAICTWAFDVLGLWRVEAGTLPENSRSRAVLEGCGFVEEGYAKAYLEIAGARRDHVLYGLVREA